MRCRVVGGFLVVGKQALVVDDDGGTWFGIGGIWRLEI